jgi:hypothetical protein
MKTKSSSRKRRTPGEIVRMKTECSLQMKTSTSPPKETLCDLTIYFSKQSKRKLKTKTTDAPRKTHSA